MFPELREFALTNIGSVDTREALVAHLGGLEERKLRELAAALLLVSPPGDEMDEGGEGPNDGRISHVTHTSARVLLTWPLSLVCSPLFINPT